MKFILNKYLILCVLVLISFFLPGQYSGTYTALIKDENYVLELKQDGNKISGNMQDASLNYIVNGILKGRKFTGKAIDDKYSISFDLFGEFGTQDLFLEADLNYEGVINDAFNTYFKKIDSSQTTKPMVVTYVPNGVAEFLTDKSININLIGTWRSKGINNFGTSNDVVNTNYNHITFNENFTIESSGSPSLFDVKKHVELSDGMVQNDTSPDYYYYTIDDKLMLYIKINEKYEVREYGTFTLVSNKLTIINNLSNSKIEYYKL